MKKKMIKKLALLTAMLFVTFLLAGCGTAGVDAGSIRVQVLELTDAGSSSIINSAIVGIEVDADGGEGSAIIHRQLTAPNGNGTTYVFKDLPPGKTYDVYVEAEGYVNEDIASQSEATGGAPRRAEDLEDRAFKRIRVEDGQEYTVVVYMKASRTPSTGDMVGIVHGVNPNDISDSVPLANATIVLQDMEGTVSYSAVSSTNGQYEIPNVPVNPLGYKIFCYAANNVDSAHIYKPLESTGGGETDTGNGSNSEIYMVPGQTVTKDIYLERTTLESNLEAEGTITAIVQSNNGINIDFNEVPMFATLYRGGVSFMAKRVEDGGLVTFENLPLNDTGILYDRLDVHSPFIRETITTNFQATLTTNQKSYAVTPPVEVVLETGDIQSVCSVSWGGNNLAGSQVTFNVSTTGASGNANITYSNASATIALNSVPVGKRKVACTATTSTANLAVTMSNGDQEVDVVKDQNTTVNFNAQAVHQ